jgi:hypothetical protein
MALICVFSPQDLTAIRHEIVYACCVEVYLDLTFVCIVQRKPLFYIVNLIVPCINISVLAVLVFLLPSDSKKKITLSISILVALLVFYLLLIELIPPTSVVIPLLGKYLLFTLVIVNLSIIITIITLNIHFRRHPTTHMLPCVRNILLIYLPKLLFMQRPPMPQKYVYVRSPPDDIIASQSLAFPWKDERRRSIARKTANHIAYIAEQIENAKKEKEVSFVHWQCELGGRILSIRSSWYKGCKRTDWGVVIYCSDDRLVPERNCREEKHNGARLVH